MAASTEDLTAAIRSAQSELGMDDSFQATGVVTQDPENDFLADTGEGESEEATESTGVEAEASQEPENDSQQAEGEESQEEEQPAETSSLSDDTTLVLDDGTQVTGRDLKDGYLRQSDYTKKTQELAEERKKVEQVYQNMEDWYRERAENPAAWVNEIALNQDSPDIVLSQAIQQSDNPTGLMARVLKDAVQSGAMSDEFNEAFGIQELAQQAKEGESDDRVARLERQLQQQEQQRQEEKQREEALAQINQQWEDIKSREGLQFSGNDETDAKLSLMRFARDKGLSDLETAWAAMAYQYPDQVPKTPQSSSTNEADPSQEPSKQEAEEAVKRKRKTTAMTTKPSSGPSAKPRKPNSVADAVREAAKEKGWQV